MDVSNQTTPGGEELIEQVASLTGLPEPWVHQELGRIVENAGHSPGTLTLEQLREAMLAYLESLQHELEEAPDAPASSDSVSSVPSETNRQNLALVSN